TLEVSDSQNVMIGGLSSVNSQMYHIVVYDCQDMKTQGVKVLADGNSPHTDDIHVERSSNVAILTSNIETGDDCISIGPHWELGGVVGRGWSGKCDTKISYFYGVGQAMDLQKTFLV
ncbi:unnamed protein product, partial [Citrullus colocynthis]